LSPNNQPHGMKSNQVDALKKSFEQIEVVGQQAGHYFYNTLFEKNPAFKSMFTSDMDLQVEKFLSTLKLIVYSFEASDDGEYRLTDDMRVPLENLGKKHQQLGVNTEMFSPVAEALLKAVEKFSGSAFTPELRKAWSDAYWEIAEAMNNHQ
jgi:hemoglobin-like flavoprotein